MAEFNPLDPATLQCPHPHLARLRGKVEGAGGPRIVAVRGVGYRIATEDDTPN